MCGEVLWLETAPKQGEAARMVQPSTHDAATLTRALLRVAEQLHFNAHLAPMLGLDESAVATLRNAQRALDPQAEEWAHAQKLVNLYRTLITLLGDVERARDWLSAPNDVLGDAPIAILRSENRERVFRYLNAVSKHELRLPTTRTRQ